MLDYDKYYSMPPLMGSFGQMFLITITG
jgi:hypothetical protein